MEPLYIAHDLGHCKMPNFVKALLFHVIKREGSVSQFKHDMKIVRDIFYIIG